MAKKVRITFTSEVYLEGEDMAHIKQQWADLPVFTADALEDAYAEILDVESVEDADTYEDLKDEFDEADVDEVDYE